MGHNITTFSTILDECIHCCRLFLTNSHVKFSWRQTNEITRTLARDVTFLVSPHNFVHVPPYINEL